MAHGEVEMIYFQESEGDHTRSCPKLLPNSGSAHSLERGPNFTLMDTVHVCMCTNRVRSTHSLPSSLYKLTLKTYVITEYVIEPRLS